MVSAGRLTLALTLRAGRGHEAIGQQSCNDCSRNRITLLTNLRVRGFMSGSCDRTALTHSSVVSARYFGSTVIHALDIGPPYDTIHLLLLCTIITTT